MNLPTFLTVVRILLIAPLCVLLWHNQQLAALAVLAVASLTDYLDGKLARKLGPTQLGKILDPLADKLLVMAVLVVLVARGQEGLVVPAVLLLAREFMVQSLREYAGLVGKELPSLGLAKWKTAIQLLALAGLIWAPAVGVWLLWLAVVLGWVSGWQYLRLTRQK